MGRFWSLLFLLVPVFGVGTFIVAATPNTLLVNHWLPENISETGGVIDGLFMFILWLTGIIFIGTGVALFWFLWKYDAERTTEPVKYMHGSHTLEVVWSILPAATLLFIAIFQMDAFADAKIRRPIQSAGPDGIEGTADDVPQPPLVEVTGRQFEWRIRYAGKDGLLYTTDDVHTVNELHIPVDEVVVVAIQSEDVLHSFFLPNMRVKQDVVPGMQQYVWFRPVRSGEFDIVCAELCGWGHYKMRGRLTVEPRGQFDAWLQREFEEQERSEYTPVEDEE